MSKSKRLSYLKTERLRDVLCSYAKLQLRLQLKNWDKLGESNNYLYLAISSYEFKLNFVDYIKNHIVITLDYKKAMENNK